VGALSGVWIRLGPDHPRLLRAIHCSSDAMGSPFVSSALEYFSSGVDDAICSLLEVVSSGILCRPGYRLLKHLNRPSYFVSRVSLDI
jgi:hypothetical protein